MQLYDQNFVDKLPPAKPWGHPTLVAFCSDKRFVLMRSMIEQWYQNLPTSVQPKLYKKLRSTDDKIFLPAFYELVAHQYCKEEGWDIDYEPVLPHNGRTPDFVVNTKSGYKFILEVTSLADSPHYNTSETEMRDLNQRISEIKTAYTLEIMYNAMPVKAANAKVVTNDVAKWLSNNIQNTEIISQTFESHGFEVTITADPNGRKLTSGVLAMAGTAGANLPFYEKRIREALDIKRKRYSPVDTGLPLVILYADIIGGIRGGQDVFDRALYGLNTMQFNTGNNSASYGRDNSGYFGVNSVAGKIVPNNPNLSALIYCSFGEVNKVFSSVHINAQVFHNPYALIPFSDLPFVKLPQFLPITNRDGQTQLRWIVNSPEYMGATFFLDDRIVV